MIESIGKRIERLRKSKGLIAVKVIQFFNRNVSAISYFDDSLNSSANIFLPTLSILGLKSLYFHSVVHCRLVVLH